MKDEIKEFEEFRNDEDGTYFYYINKDGNEQWSYKLDNLKDYIINLQKEYQTELDENYKLTKWLVKKQKRIEKAREFLDDEYNYKKGDAKFNRTDYVIWESLKNILNGSDE